MHGYDVLDPRVLNRESVAFFFFNASVNSKCSAADARWFACTGGVASQVVADGV